MLLCLRTMTPEIIVQYIVVLASQKMFKYYYLTLSTGFSADIFNADMAGIQPC